MRQTEQVAGKEERSNEEKCIYIYMCVCVGGGEKYIYRKISSHFYIKTIVLFFFNSK